MLLARSWKHCCKLQTSIDISPINDPSSDQRRARRNEEWEKDCFVARDDLNFVLVINACRYRHSTSIVLQVTVHIAVCPARCVTFNFPPPPLPPAHLYIVSRGPSCVHLSIALVTNFAAGGPRKHDFDQWDIYVYIFFLLQEFRTELLEMDALLGPNENFKNFMIYAVVQIIKNLKIED